MKAGVCMVLWALALIAVPRLAAQDIEEDGRLFRPYRSGWWGENGVGTGTIRLGCSNCPQPTSYFGQSSYLRIGHALSSKVHIALEGFTLLDRSFPAGPQDSVRIENNSGAVVVLWYPWRGGLFLKGGTGVAYANFNVPTAEGGPPVVATGVGSSLTFGVGFDIPVLKWLAITANFGTYFTALGDITVGRDDVDDAIATMYNANFAITIR